MLQQSDIDDLWRGMTRVFGDLWVRRYGPIDDGTWLAGLSSLAPGQLRFGMMKCVDAGSKWPPNLPEFKAMCFPSAEDLGVPDLKAAYSVASDICLGARIQPHPVVAAVINACGGCDTLRDAARPFTLFENRYAEVLRRLQAGEDLGDIPLALPKKPREVNRAVGAKEIKKLRGILNVRRSGGEGEGARKAGAGGSGGGATEGGGDAQADPCPADGGSPGGSGVHGGAETSF